ncbi:hypothetical protein V5799_030476 [Amblyomma americanum]|uniref:Anoctamin dimerisation domain-containing protein n=1 Tax=Amblyomma americanum TaxID=6943 RepID=A0AAQ4EN80_AMBAM
MGRRRRRNRPSFFVSHFSTQTCVAFAVVHFQRAKRRRARDGKRRIDFVLAYQKHDDSVSENYRRVFEDNLIKEGLDLELEDSTTSRDGKTNFLKIHAPWKVLVKYAEKLHLRMPIKLGDESTEIENESKPNALEAIWAKMWTPFPYNKELIPDEKQYFNAEFVRQREHMYIIQNKDTIFSQAIRSRIAWEVLMRTTYDDNDRQKGEENFT